MKRNPYLQDYHRTIICDIDDTISSSTDHIWENAKPISTTIDKINSLYDSGWIIILQTARGQLSCGGDFEAADKKYRQKMEKWLSDHGVKYHMLSFEKYLAAFYIDDKAITPEDFYDLDIREIKSGWSGAKVEKRGDKIFKTHPDSIDAAKWYAKAEPIINTPKVYSVIGNTICLEYLHDSGRRFKIDELNDIINKFSMCKSYVPFETYIKRIEDHCNFNNDFYAIIPLLWDHKDYFNKFRTFMHGDMSIENVIDTENGIYLIDPIYNTELWSSFLLDITKMLHSYRKHKRVFEYEVFKNTWLRNKDLNLDENMLLLLEATHFIRVIKYCKIESVRAELIETTRALVLELTRRIGSKHANSHLSFLLKILNRSNIMCGLITGERISSLSEFVYEKDDELDFSGNNVYKIGEIYGTSVWVNMELDNKALYDMSGNALTTTIEENEVNASEIDDGDVEFYPNKSEI